MQMYVFMDGITKTQVPPHGNSRELINKRGLLLSSKGTLSYISLKFAVHRVFL